MPHLKTVVCALGIFLTGFLLSGCEKEKAPVKKGETLKVHTLEAKSVTQPYWVDVFGQTEGQKAVLIYPQVTGPILERKYVEGQHVKEGDTLFVIDPAPFQASYNIAAAALEQAKVNLKKAEREAKRYTDLWKAKAVSQKEYDDAVSAKHVAKAAMQSAEAQANAAKITLGYTNVKAPVSGIAGRALVNPGAIVTANQTQLTDLTQDQHLKVRFSASDHDLHGYKLSNSTKVTVTNKNLPAPVDGTLDFTATQVDPKTGTRALSAVLKPSQLLPGQYVTVRMFLGDQDGVFLIPQKSVRQLSDGGYALFVLENGKARNRLIKVGRWIGKDWIVTSGLKDGDVVIIDQIQRLRDRQPVQNAGSLKADKPKAAKEKSAA